MIVRSVQVWITVTVTSTVVSPGAAAGADTLEKAIVIVLPSEPPSRALMTKAGAGAGASPGRSSWRCTSEASHASTSTLLLA